MEKTEQVLKKVSLFQGLSPASLHELFTRLKVTTKRVAKHEYVYRQGEALYSFGVVLSGRVLLEQEDFWGNHTIIAQISAGDLFAEVYILGGEHHLPVSIQASEAAEILFIEGASFWQASVMPSSFHQQLYQNIVQLLTRKNRFLLGKIEHISKRTLREKILSYLSTMALQQSSSKVVIPYNRQEFADYLAVNRSALSRELAKLKAEGILTYHLKEFELQV